MTIDREQLKIDVVMLLGVAAGLLLAAACARLDRRRAQMESPVSASDGVRTPGLPPPGTGAAEASLLPRGRSTRIAAGPRPDVLPEREAPRAPRPGEVPRPGRPTLVAAKPSEAGLARLFAAIRHVESADGLLPVGDGGRSLGAYHIGRDYWADGCGIGRVSWPYGRLVQSRPHCEAVMVWYWLKWCPAALAAGDLQTLARVHNGGPAGPRKRATAAYWRRIQRSL